MGHLRRRDHPGTHVGLNGYGTGRCGGSNETVCGVRGIFSGNLAASDPTAGGSTAISIVSGATWSSSTAPRR